MLWTVHFLKRGGQLVREGKSKERTSTKVGGVATTRRKTQ